MNQSITTMPLVPALLCAAISLPAAAAPTTFFFSTGNPDHLVATATRPSTGAPFEIESADDFVLTTSTVLTSATFTGLVPAGTTAADIKDVVVEIYGVFPVASNVGRTSGPAIFSTPEVPTRLNSPSDVALDSRDSAAGTLSFTPTTLAAMFTSNNSIQPGGIHPIPNQTTGGNGPVTGQEEQFNVTFTEPFSFPGGHFFFVPQVELDNGNFLWLSAPKPIVAPGTQFPPGFTDLQSWTRDDPLEPDWLRVGTDIIGGATTFNETFSITGIVPEPGTLLVLGTALVGMGLLRRR